MFVKVGQLGSTFRPKILDLPELGEAKRAVPLCSIPSIWLMEKDKGWLETDSKDGGLLVEKDDLFAGDNSNTDIDANLVSMVKKEIVLSLFVWWLRSVEWPFHLRGLVYIPRRVRSII